MSRRRKLAYSGLPKKGSKRREILLRLIRPEGITSKELEELGLGKPSELSGVFTALANEQGWDIRTFPCPPERRKPSAKYDTKPELIYKAVGRLRWDCSYRSLITFGSQES